MKETSEENGRAENNKQREQTTEGHMIITVTKCKKLEIRL